MLHYFSGFTLIALLAAIIGAIGISVGPVEILLFALPLMLITSYLVGLLRNK